MSILFADAEFARSLELQDLENCKNFEKAAGSDVPNFKEIMDMQLSLAKYKSQVSFSSTFILLYLQCNFTRIFCSEGPIVLNIINADSDPFSTAAWKKILSKISPQIGETNAGKIKKSKRCLKMS